MDNLVKQAKKGNKDAFDKLITENIPYMYKMGYRVLKNDDEISDAIQNTVIKIYANIKKLKDDTAFKTWMITILLNECRDVIRKRNKIVYLEDTKTEIQYEEKEITQNKIDLENAISKLNEDLKMIISLYYYQDIGINEIAKILEIPEGTVKSRLYKARELLYGYLSKEDVI